MVTTSSCAFATQRDILKKYEAQNEASHNRYMKLFKQGHTIAYETSITGPYTTQKSYTMSNGESINFVWASSLGWSMNTIVQNPYY